MRELLPWGGHHLYDRLVARPLRAFYGRIAAGLPDGRTLDIGCGPGHLAAHIAATGRVVVAVDKDPAQVRIARRNHPDLDVRIAAAEDLPFDDAAFDVVVTSESFHHWSDTDAGTLEALRVLRPGGTFVVVEGAGDASNAEIRAFLGRRPWPGLGVLIRAIFRVHGYLPDALARDVVPVLARYFENVRVERVEGWFVVRAGKGA